MYGRVITGCVFSKIGGRSNKLDTGFAQTDTSFH